MALTTSRAAEEQLHRIRTRRQSLAGAVRQLLLDLDRARVPITHQRCLDRERQLLTDALAPLIASSEPPRRPRSTVDRELDALASAMSRRLAKESEAESESEALEVVTP